LERLETSGPRASRPAQFVDTLISMPASRVGIAYRLRGSTAVLGGSNAVEVALDWVRAGRDHAIVAGAAEYLSPKCVRYYRELARASGSDRALLAQGAAFVVVEDAEHAEARGIRSHAELLGAGAASEPQRVSVPWGSYAEGAFTRSMRSALVDGGAAADDVGLIVRAAGDDASDRAEAPAIRAVFGERDASLRLVRPKRALGEALSASGPLALLAALATSEDEAPTIAVANAFELGGGASSIVLRLGSPK
jgi:3-oxoacyl-[acyl-carrier-protein] synthase II